MFSIDLLGEWLWLQATGNLNIRGIIERAERRMKDEIKPWGSITRKELCTQYLTEHPALANEFWKCWDEEPKDVQNKKRTKEEAMAVYISKLVTTCSGRTHDIYVQFGQLNFDERQFTPRDVCAVKLLATIVDLTLMNFKFFGVLGDADDPVLS